MNRIFPKAAKILSDAYNDKLVETADMKKVDALCGFLDKGVTPKEL